MNYNLTYSQLHVILPARKTHLKQRSLLLSSTKDNNFGELLLRQDWASPNDIRMRQPDDHKVLWADMKESSCCCYYTFEETL